MPDSAASRSGDLWGVTAYYNPIGYKRRRSNYDLFRKHLNLPLVTVELAYGDEFELGAQDADILLQLRGRDVMWQKERLLNIALAALPPGCTKIAWLDCDLVFQSAEWAEATSRLLDRHALVQPFTQVYRARPEWRPGDVLPEQSRALRAVGDILESGVSVDACVRGGGEETRCAHGMAWASRRELVERCGFYDANVIGGGDAVIFRSAFGYFDLVAERMCLGANWREHYRDWAEPFHREVRGNVGNAPGNVVHLWHGAVEYRRYRKRFREFAAFEFDPLNDIAVNGDGAWRWNTAKPEMHAFLRDYFVSRREDG